MKDKKVCAYCCKGDGPHAPVGSVSSQRRAPHLHTDRCYLRFDGRRYPQCGKREGELE